MANITCPVSDPTGICSLLEGTGAGLGIFINYLALSLPILLVVIAVVGGIVVIMGAIGKLIGSKIHTK
jgi:hypothetical protein